LISDIFWQLWNSFAETSLVALKFILHAICTTDFTYISAQHSAGLFLVFAVHKIFVLSLNFIPRSGNWRLLELRFMSLWN